MDTKENQLFLAWIDKPFFDTFDKFNKGNFEKGLSGIYCRASKFLELLKSSPRRPLNSVINLSDPTNKEIERVITLVHERNEEIEYIINKVGKFKFEGMSLAECKVLIAEMLWGRQFLKIVNLHIQTVRYHEETIRDLYLEVINVIDNPVDYNKCKFPTYVRINTLAISIEDAINAFYKEGWNLIPRSKSYENYLDNLENLHSKEFIRDYHISELLAFPPGTSFLKHPGFLGGKFLIQDKGSCLSSFLLNPKPHSIVLDATAAPGLKTNHLANIMGNTGRIYANDIHKERIEMMYQLLKKTNVTNTLISEENFFKISLDKKKIEYILLDPASSYSGIFLLAEKEHIKFSLRHSNYKLSMLLEYTLLTFPNVKRVVFTTCSVHPEEGEQVVDYVLEEICESYTLLDAKQMLWNEWHSMSLPEYKCATKCIRIHPEYDQCQGWFIAVFERNFNVPLPPFRFKNSLKRERIKEIPNNSVNNDVNKRFCPNLIKQIPNIQQIQPINVVEVNQAFQSQASQNASDTLIKKSKSQRKKERRRLRKLLGNETDKIKTLININLE